VDAFKSSYGPQSRFIIIDKSDFSQKSDFLAYSQFTIHHSSFTIHHSPFTIHNSPFIIHHSSFIIHHSSFIIHQSKKFTGVQTLVWQSSNFSLAGVQTLVWQ